MGQTQRSRRAAGRRLSVTCQGGRMYSLLEDEYGKSKEARWPLNYRSRSETRLLRHRRSLLARAGFEIFRLDGMAHRS
jgi:hypothetical protein